MIPPRISAPLCPLLLLAASLSGCGYHVAGKADLLPKDIQTIAIPSFGNATTRYQLSQRLTASLTREFISRTRYRIVADPGDADAVLTGSVLNFFSFPTVAEGGRSAVVQAIVGLQVEMRSRAGTVLYSKPNLEFRERYEISVSSQAFFEESESAMERLSRDVARTVVSSVLEAF